MRQVQEAAWGVAGVFALNGVAFAVHASRIPTYKAQLGLNDSSMGALLLFLSVGAILGLPLAGSVSTRFGSVRTVVGGSVLVTAGLVLLGLGADVLDLYWMAGVGYFLIGLGSGTWDVAMNLEGTVVEQRLGRSIMPWFHAAFSAATVVVALVAAGLIALGLPAWVQLTVAAVLLTPSTWWSTRSFLPGAVPTEAEREDKPSALSAWTEPRTLMIGLVVMAAGLTEGAANDWIALAMVDGHGLSEAFGTLGLAVFLGFMTVGRLLGTGALDRRGRVPVLLTLFALAAAGCLLVVFGGPVLAFFGAALWGIGASLGFPVGFSAASDDPVHASARVSVVSTIGYTAFLAGPPLLGFLSDQVGILNSLLAVGATALLAMVLVPATRPLPQAGQAT